MSESAQTAAPAAVDTGVISGGDTWTPPATNSSEPWSARDAARSLSDARNKRDAEMNKTVEAQEPAAEPEKLSPEDNAAPQVEAPGETAEAEPAEELSPLEAPRSWTKAEKEEFASYPRGAQEAILRRAQDMDKAVRQSQNEAAEKTKALSAKEQAAEQLRQQYEAKLPEIAQMLQAAQAANFSDIKSIADVERLAAEDPLKYLQWTAHQQKVAAVQQEMKQAQDRHASEWQAKWDEFAQKADKDVSDRIPDLADPVKRGKVQEGARTLLKDVGFSDDELASSWNGQLGISLRDARMQEIINDARQWREAKTKSRQTLVAKPLPPVQRPGAAKAPGADKAAQIQAINKQLETATSMQALKLGAQLLKLERAS